MAETIRIEIPVEVRDNTKSGVSSVERQLRGMENASRQTERTVTGFDKTAQKTQRSLSQMVKEKYQVVLEALDKVSPAASKVYGSLRNIGGKAWSVTMKAVDLVTAPVKGIINLLKNPILQAGAVLGVSVGFKDTVDTFANFEAAMSQVKAISGATGPEFEKLTAKAKQMGATTKFTAAESAEAFNYMAMAGWKTKDMMNGIEGIMNLAAASGESLGTTSDIVTDALTAFRMKAEDATHFADVLAAASSNSNTTVSMMGETFKYVGSVAGSMGYSIEDMALATGLMANSGVKASMAGTQLNNIISRLATNTNGAQDAIKELGVEFFNSNGSARKFSDVMEDLRKATADMTHEQKADIASTIAGTRAQNGLIDILDASIEDYEKLKKAVNEADGASKKMSDTMLDNLKGAFTLLQSAADGVKLSLGERMKPYLMDLATWLADQMPNIEKGLMQFMDFVDEKVDAVKAKIAEFTATDEWENADLFEKIHIAWDELIAQPFGEWWSTTGREFFVNKARSLGEGLGKGISSGLLALLGIDLKGAADEGQSIGAAFAKGFINGFDMDAVKDALGNAMKGLFSNAAKILPGGEKADLSSWLSAAFLAKLITPLLGLGLNTFSLGKAIFGGGAGGLGLGSAILGSAASGTGIKGLLASAGMLGMNLGSAATSGAGLIAAGTGAVAGGAIGGITLISAAKDIYTSVKSDDPREKNAYARSGVLKVGGVGAGAATGAMIGSIVPGIGTAAGALIGAGIGGIAGWFTGNREKRSYEEELEKEQKALEEQQEALRKSSLQEEKAKYSSDIMRKAFDETTLSVDEFKQSQEYAALMVEETSRNMKKHFGSVALSVEEIQALAKRLTLGTDETAFEEFAKAADLADTRAAALKDTMSDLNRLEWKAGFGLALTVQEQDDYKSTVEEYVNNARNYVEDKQYEFTTSISLLMDISEGSRGEGILNGANDVYAGLKEQVSAYGEQLQKVLGTALADGVISGKDKMKLQIDGVDVELPEDEAIAELQGKIQEITERMSTAQQKSSMEALKIKYGSGQMDYDSFQSFQQELAAQGEQTAQGYYNAMQSGLAGFRMMYPDGGAEYDAAVQELSKSYHANMDRLNQDMQDFQFDTLAESYSVAFETAFADMDLEGIDFSEKIQSAMKNATADGVDVSVWDVETASKYLGLDKLSKESAAAITQITSDIAKTLPGKLSEAFAGGESGTVGGGGSSPMSLLAGLPENIASELQGVDFSPVGTAAGTAIDTAVSTYLSGGASAVDGSPYASALNGQLQSAMTPDAFAGTGSQAVSAADAAVTSSFTGHSVAATLDVLVTPIVSLTKTSSTITASGTGGSGSGTVTFAASADGRFVDSPMMSWIGEDGPEFVVPVGAKRRQRGIELWQQAGEMLGVGRFADGGLAGGRFRRRDTPGHSAGIVPFPEEKNLPAWAGQEDSGDTGKTAPSAGDSTESGNASGGGIKIEVNLNPTFQITESGGNGTDDSSVVSMIQSHLREMADDLAGEIADKLEGVFGNMPKGA